MVEGLWEFGTVSYVHALSCLIWPHHTAHQSPRRGFEDTNLLARTLDLLARRCYFPSCQGLTTVFHRAIQLGSGHPCSVLELLLQGLGKVGSSRSPKPNIPSPWRTHGSVLGTIATTQHWGAVTWGQGQGPLFWQEVGSPRPHTGPPPWSAILDCSGWFRALKPVSSALDSREVQGRGQREGQPRGARPEERRHRGGGAGGR